MYMLKYYFNFEHKIKSMSKLSIEPYLLNTEIFEFTAEPFDLHYFAETRQLIGVQILCISRRYSTVVT
jgi:hypothetical protein